jgi:sporulation protein YlmC with PRC-barrel domain
MDHAQLKRYFLFSLLLVFSLTLSACNDEPEETIITGDDIIIESRPGETDIVEGAVTPITEDVVVQGTPAAEITPTAETTPVQELVVTPVAPATGAEIQVTATPSTGEQAAADQAVMVKAATLLELEVDNVQGQDLGDLSDLVVDASTGQIPYAILNSSGFLGFGGEDLLIPFSAFALSQTGNELLLPFVSPDQIENAPTVSADWPTWGDMAWADRGATFWGQTEFGQAVPGAGHSASALRISNLMGYSIGAYGQMGAGSIVNILVDLESNQAKWLVVDYADAAVATGAETGIDYAAHLVLIPFDAMDWQNLGQEIFFDPNIDAAAFAGAPLVLRDEFEQAEFLNPNFDAEVVSYWEGYGVQFEGR